ncbi:MAG: GreA/GreB family elongation factor [Verrucomicrobiae bacterium]|nr:GreA/GreB family elongation factor [Verrucomicrobiae bacterium]
MNLDELQGLIASGRLTQAQAQKLVTLSPGAFCMHRSWSFGRIHSYDLVLGQVIVDFKSKPQHKMQLEYAADSLMPVPAEHLLARKAADLEAFRAECADKEKQAGVVRRFAMDYGEIARPEMLEQILVPEVVPADGWKKWMSDAKRACRKDSHILWPTRKADPIRLVEKPPSLSDALMERLLKSRSLPDVLDVAEDALRKLSKADDLKALVPELLKAIEGHIVSAKDRDPAVVVEATWVRDDLKKILDASVQVADMSVLIKEVHDLHDLVVDLSPNRQRHILPMIKKAFPDWESRMRTLLDTANQALITEVVAFLKQEGRSGHLREIFESSIREGRADHELLIWTCRNREDPEYAAWLPSLINGRLLAAILNRMENDTILATTRRRNPLALLLRDDATLMADLVRASDTEEARDLGRRLLTNPAIEELDKRSLIARIIKISPSVQSLLVADQQSQSEALIVSWESLERRKDEYEELISQRIPENSREIATARSQGDLRENAGFKAAKEMQAVLMRRKAELEEQLARARATDFYKPDTSAVNVGTKVSLVFLDKSEPWQVTILGAWDGNPDLHIVSYQTPFAAALLGQKVGGEVVLPSENGGRRARIEKIEPALDEADFKAPPAAHPEVEIPGASIASEPKES